MQNAAEHQPITVSGAARILEVSEDTVRRLHAAGVLPASRTPAGMRIFARGDVERVATERARSGGRSTS
jgi:excisionase family DNA binding protein